MPELVQPRPGHIQAWHSRQSTPKHIQVPCKRLVESLLASADSKTRLLRIESRRHGRHAFKKYHVPTLRGADFPLSILLFSLNVPPIMLYTAQASASPSRPLRGPAMSALRLNFERSPSRQAKQRLWLATAFRTEDRVFDSDIVVITAPLPMLYRVKNTP
jgi:hypothetical protein